MIRWMSTSQIAGGKGVQAVQWATEHLEFIKKYDALPPVEVFTNLVGDGGVMTWFIDYEDLSAYDKVHKQVSADPEYAQEISNAGELFIPGSNKVTIMNKINT